MHWQDDSPVEARPSRNKCSRVCFLSFQLLRCGRPFLNSSVVGYQKQSFWNNDSDLKFMVGYSFS